MKACGLRGCVGASTGPNRRRKEERRRRAAPAGACAPRRWRRDAFLNETRTVSRIETSTLASLSLPRGYQLKGTCSKGGRVFSGDLQSPRRREIRSRRVQQWSHLIFLFSFKVEGIGLKISRKSNLDLAVDSNLYSDSDLN